MVRASRAFLHLRAAVQLQRVRERAREIARSAESGTDEENWLRAERDVQRSWVLPPLPPAQATPSLGRLWYVSTYSCPEISRIAYITSSVTDRRIAGALSWPS